MLAALPRLPVPTLTQKNISLIIRRIKDKLGRGLQFFFGTLELNKRERMAERMCLVNEIVPIRHIRIFDIPFPRGLRFAANIPWLTLSELIKNVHTLILPAAKH